MRTIGKVFLWFFAVLFGGAATITFLYLAALVIGSGLSQGGL